MGGLAVLALLAERPPAAANALGWAVILLLLDQPDVALSPAFQLTVSATAGLLLLAPRLARRWQGRWIPARLAEAVAASVGAQLATLPWALPRFHMLSPLAPLLNLPAVPWTGLALIASLAWTAVALLSPTLGRRTAPGARRSGGPVLLALQDPAGGLAAGAAGDLAPIWAWLLAAGVTVLLLLAPSASPALSFLCLRSLSSFASGRARPTAPIPSWPCSTSAKATRFSSAMATTPFWWTAAVREAATSAAGCSCRPCWARGDPASTPWS